MRTGAWNQLRRETYEPEKTIAWALIEQKELKNDLTAIYDHITKYNRSIDELTALGEQRTKRSFQKVNSKREQLISELKSLPLNIP